MTPSSSTLWNFEPMCGELSPRRSAHGKIPATHCRANDNKSTRYPQPALSTGDGVSEGLEGRPRYDSTSPPARRPRCYRESGHVWALASCLGSGERSAGHAGEGRAPLLISQAWMKPLIDLGEGSHAGEGRVGEVRGEGVTQSYVSGVSDTSDNRKESGENEQ